MFWNLLYGSFVSNEKSIECFSYYRRYFEKKKFPSFPIAWESGYPNGILLANGFKCLC